MRRNNKSSTLGFPYPITSSQISPELSGLAEAEILDFYKYFIEINTSLTAEVEDFQVLEENGKTFAVYHVLVTTSLLSYKIFRRYSQFYELREKLIKNYQALNFQSIQFPDKQFFGNLNEATLNQRKMILNNFINLICSKSLVFPLLELWEFLDIRTRYTLELRRQASFQQDFLDAKSKSEEAHILFSFLELLNKEPLEITNTLKQIDKFYSVKKPRLGPDMAKTLLIGAGRARGLLYFCGKYDKETNAHLSCSVGLPLLLSLMSYDNNKEAEIFQEIFSTCKVKYLKDLNLDCHLLGETQRRCKQPALQLIDIYINKNSEMELDQLLQDPAAREEFWKWKYPRKCNSRKTEKFKIVDMNSPLTSLKQNQINFMNPEKFLSPSSQLTHETEETSSSSPKNNFFRSEALFEKSSEEKASSWVKLPTKDSFCCQIKHQNYANLTYQIIVNAKPQNCLPYLTEKLTWMPNFHSVTFKKSNEKEYSEVHLKLKTEDTPNIQFISYIYKILINEDENGVVNIKEKCLEKKDLKLSDTELVGNRSCRVVLTPIKNNMEMSQTKIKISIKNLDNVSIKFSINELFRDSDKIERSLYSLKNLIEKT